MIRIITDSAASIPAAVARERSIEVVSMYVNHEGVEYVDAEMDVDEFYQGIHTMVDNPPTSSQPAQGIFDDLFEAAAKCGDEVLGVFISSKMSGTFESAVRSARRCKERYDQFRCALIDSTSNCGDEASSVLDAADVRDEGGDLSACTSAAERAVKCSRFVFTPESLTFLKAGGRIGGAAALVGNLLKLAPVLTVSDWETSTLAKVRSGKKALARMAQTFRDDIEKCGLKRVVVHYIGSAAPAIAWARETIEPLVGRAVEVLPVSPVIGTHVGPAVGLAYECERPLEGKFTGSTRDLVFAL